MVFISPLRGLRCNNDKRFFSCATIFTTRWSRDKYFFLFWYYVYYSMIKRKKVSFFISSLHLLCYGHRGKKRFLLHLDYGTIMKKYSCFLFHYGVHYANISLYIILHLPTTLTTSLACQKKSPSQKNIHNLKSRLRSRFDITLSFLNINHINLKPHARFWVYSSNHYLMIFKLPG